MIIGTIALEVVILGVAYASVAFFLQRKVSNIDKVNEIRNKINVHQKELNEMMKNKVPNTDLEKKQQEMMAMLSESMKYQMKGMFVVVPMFILFYYFLLPAAFTGISGNIATLFTLGFTYQTLFVGSAFVTGIILLISVTIVTKLNKARQSADQGSASANDAKA